MCGFSCSLSFGCPEKSHHKSRTNSVNDPNCVSSVNGNGHSTNGHPEKTIRSQLQASLDSISHRGPDAHGIWMSDDLSVCLGHCRLSINDLTPAGEQPLHSDCGEIHAVVNGEIYDFDRLRKLCSKVHGYTFSSHSDSELVIALYKIFGTRDFLGHLRGEFSFVLYDSREGSKKVVAGRDRFGIKPLFYTEVDGRLLFASENKAFLGMGWKPEWDIDAIASGASLMGGTATLFKGVKKVLPGHYLEVTEDSMQEREYYDIDYEDKTKVEARTIDEMVLGVRERLVNAIRLRMRADVPIGVYLSGGIDSSAIAGIMAHLAKERHVKMGSVGPEAKLAAFSISFPGKTAYDEGAVADRTAQHLGIETVKVAVDEARLAADFCDAVYHCEQDVWDLNFVAKFALSRLPREHGFKVVLTGEGADEIFSGYPFLPSDFLQEPDHAMPEAPLTADPALYRDVRDGVEAETQKIYKIMGLDQSTAGADPMAEAGQSSIPKVIAAWAPYKVLFAPWVRETRGESGLDTRRSCVATHSAATKLKMREKWHPLHTGQYLWIKASLQNVILTNLGDRSEMAHSIEARTPFLDHYLADYVNALPPSVKVSYGSSESSRAAAAATKGVIWSNTSGATSHGLQSLTEKWILREAVKPFVTDELYKRRKHPFVAPTTWPRDGPLHDVFAGLLTREAVEAVGFLDWPAVEEALRDAFGDDARPKSFRTVCQAAAFVTIAQRFGVAKAVPPPESV